MKITKLELLAVNLPVQREFYTDQLQLPVKLTASSLVVQAGGTELVFSQAPADFEGAYHFAFNIPENQFQAAKLWLTGRISLLHDKSGNDEFASQNWHSDSIYFLDAAGNVLEFIARHALQNAVAGDFNSRQILNICEIGLPSEDVIGVANELCTRLGLLVYRQQPNENFTPVGDENGLFILPIKGRIWMPDSGVRAEMLPVRIWGEAGGKMWEIRGAPYEIDS